MLCSYYYVHTRTHLRPSQFRFLLMGCPVRGPPARRPTIVSLRTVSPLQVRAVLRVHR